MSRHRLHPESHRVSRIGWLRAAVLGANDDIISTASRGTGGWRHVYVRGRACLRQLTIAVMRAGLADMCRSRTVGEFRSHRTSPRRLQDMHREEDPVGGSQPQNGWLRRRR